MSNKTLNDVAIGIQQAAHELSIVMAKQLSGNWYELRIKCEAAATKQVSRKWGIEALEKLVAMQGELIEEQSSQLKTGKTNAEQALGFIGQIMNHTEDTHIEHFVDMAEQWLSKGFAPVMVADFETDTPQWQSVEQFEKSEYRGRCWIRYKGRPVICIYTGERYTFGNGGGCYMTECISGVIPIPAPSAEVE